MKSLLFTVLLVGMALCGAEARLNVLAMNPLLADLAKQVGGDAISVTSLIPPGQDLHEFSPSPGDISQVRHARIVFLSGLGLEAGFLAKLQSDSQSGPLFVSLGDAIPPMASLAHDDAHDHDHGENAHGTMDPHWWQSISNVRIAVRVIRDTFIAADPSQTQTFQTRAATFDRQLGELSRWIRVTVAAIPRDRRILVTSHDAFGYFARDYGFTVRPVSGLSTEDKPSSQSVRVLIAAIKSDQVGAIFLENAENPKVLTEITRETGARIGGTLYAGSLGTKEATTYEDMMRHNVTTIVKGLRTPKSKQE